MSERKIADEPSRFRNCQHQEHDPATMLYRESGTYEHTCPGCGEKQIFTVSNPTM